jgi:hypothetical protein
MVGKRCLCILSVFAGLITIPVSLGQVADGGTTQRSSIAMAKLQEKSTAAEEKPASKNDRDTPVDPSAVSNPVLWQMPEDIAGLDLFYGQGGEQRQPMPPFSFLRGFSGLSATS